MVYSIQSPALVWGYVIELTFVQILFHSLIIDILDGYLFKH